MANSILQLGPIPEDTELPRCTPQLMPFHIDYSGQALISSYLRIEAANDTVAAPPPKEEAPPNAIPDDGKTGGGPESPEKPGDNPADLKVEEEATETAASTPLLAKRVTEATTRFISSFRGRTIQGLKVQLPEGYGGLVLRTDALGGAKIGKPKSKVVSKAKKKQKAAPKGRATRSAARSGAAEDVIEVDGDAMEEDEGEHNLGEQSGENATRILMPSSQFSSLMFWHPDNPADETRDDYIRTLKEWTQLAHEIHKPEL